MFFHMIGVSSQMQFNLTISFFQINQPCLNAVLKAIE